MKLAVQNRTVTGKKVKALRKEGIVPAIVYGRHLDAPISISINKVQLVKTYKQAGRSTPVELGGDIDQLVLFQDIQLHPVTDHVLHVDFVAVNKDEKVTAEVPVKLTGVSPFERLGQGRVQLLRNNIEVEALPMDLPHDITIDISEMDHDGQVLFAKELPLGDKVELKTDPELAVVTTVAFVEEVEEEEVVEEVAGEATEGESEEKAAE